MDRSRENLLPHKHGDRAGETTCAAASQRGGLKGLRRGLLLPSLQLKSQFGPAAACFCGAMKVEVVWGLGHKHCWGTKAAWRGHVWACGECCFPELAPYFRREQWPVDVGSVGCKMRDRKQVALEALAEVFILSLVPFSVWLWERFEKVIFLFWKSWLLGGESSKEINKHGGGAGNLRACAAMLNELFRLCWGWWLESRAASLL